MADLPEPAQAEFVRRGPDLTGSGWLGVDSGLRSRGAACRTLLGPADLRALLVLAWLPVALPALAADRHFPP